MTYDPFGNEINENDMKEKTDNELIAEFHDGTTFDEGGLCTDLEKKYSWRPGVYDPLRVEHLNYHASWDWLMPVVDKIERIKNSDDYEVDIFGNCCDIGGRFEAIGKTKIEATYKAVIEFIKWYNANKKP